MKRAFSFLCLLLLFLLISAPCSRNRNDSPEFGLPEILIPDGLGVNIHFPGAPNRDMDLIEKAHIRFIRADLTWAKVEREKGRYDFTGYDQLVDSFAARGGRILFILDYNNPLYGKETSISTGEQRKGFANFAAEAATRYKGKGIIWEIWNEPNLKKFWGDEPSVDDYMALVKITSRAIRKADRDALIIGPATCGCDGGFIKRCIERGFLDFVDGVSVHPYREGVPETVVKCYDDLRAIFAKYAVNGKYEPHIVSSEWGWGLSSMTKETDTEAVPAVPDSLQPAYLTRRFCIEAYAGVACAIHYKWRENNHGLIRNDYELKPAYTAFKVLNEQLTGFCSSITRLEAGDADSVFVLLFEGPSGKKIAAWRIEGRETVAVPFEGREVKGVDFLGAPVRFTVESGILELTISEKPVFITLNE